MNAYRPKRNEISATLVPTLWLMAGCFGLLVVGLQARPPWWNARGAVNSSATTNNYAVVNQGQLKQFTARAVDELNADLATNGGAGSTLSNLVYNWKQDYATNHYSTNAVPYKPADFNAVNVGQLKYIGKQVWSRLVTVGYTNALPTWLNTTNAGDFNAANIGELKTVFNFDLSGAPLPVTSLTATAAVGEIDLSWTLPGTNTAASLLVQQSTDGGTTWTTVQTLSPTATSYVAGGLSTGTNYQYRIASMNTMQNASANSAVTAATQTVSSALSAPTGLAGSYNTYQTMSLWWTASTGASSYVIERENLATGVWSVVGTASGTTYTDSNDPASLGVHYRVHAVGGSGQSGPSGEYPTLRYAVIDLGTNNYPVAFNNAGSVVLQLGTNTYTYTYPSFNGGTATGTAYPYGYWTNGAVSATLPLATIGGMNNWGDVVGTTTNYLSLYCPGEGEDGSNSPISIPLTYFPTSKWNGGSLTQVGPVPTQHVMPAVLYDVSNNYHAPANPITTTAPNSQVFSWYNDTISALPVGITDSGTTYGTMSEYFSYYPTLGANQGWGSYLGSLDSGSPPGSVTVGTFGQYSQAGLYSSLMAVNANGQAIGGYNTNGPGLPTTWVAFDGTSYHTLNGIPQYIANNNNIVGTDNSGTNTLLFTNGSANGIALTNAPCGPINSSNQIVGGNSVIWETNIVTKLADVAASTNWDFYPATYYSVPPQANSHLGNGAINDNGAMVGVAYLNDANGNPVYDASGNYIRKGEMLVPAKVSWVTIGSNTPVDDNNDPVSGNPMPGGGKRIYPDKQNPTDTGTGRNKVTLRVDTGGAGAGWTVYVKAFDVADPTPDPTQVIHPHGTATGDMVGGDNFTDPASTPLTGSFTNHDSTVDTAHATLDSTGKANFEFNVGYEPGNNYRVAVTFFNSTALSSLQVTDSTQLGYVPMDANKTPLGFSGTMSPPLTVWRRLWIEQDSMVAVPSTGSQKNFISGSVVSITRDSPVTGQSTIGSGQLFGDSANRFENGTMTINGISYPVISNTNNSLVADTVVITGTPSDAAVLGKSYTLVDDDEYGLPSGWSPLLPRFSIINNAVISRYTPAYILLVDAAGYNAHTTISFYLNDETSSDMGASKDLTTSATCWTHLVTAAYQPNQNEDRDPNTESPLLGGTFTSMFSSDKSVSVIWLETIRDGSDVLLRSSNPAVVSLGQAQFINYVANITAHETGHAPGNQTEAQDHSEGGIMTEGGESGNSFTTPSLLRFRKSQTWNGD